MFHERSPYNIASNARAQSTLVEPSLPRCQVLIYPDLSVISRGSIRRRSAGNGWIGNPQRPPHPCFTGRGSLRRELCFRTVKHNGELFRSARILFRGGRHDAEDGMNTRRPDMAVRYPFDELIFTREQS